MTARIPLAGTAAVLACAAAVCASSLDPEPGAQVRSVPRGRPVTIDGSVSGPEWVDSDSVSLRAGDSAYATVRFKHDGSSLLALFVFRRPHGVGFCIPEVLVDPNGDRSGALLPDDWWLHVSAQACEARGRIDDYSGCSRSPDWGVARLYQLAEDPTAIDTIEVAIPFAKLGLRTGRTFGLAFRVEYSVRAGGAWRSSRGLWPSDATATAPVSWGTFTIAE